MVTEAPVRVEEEILVALRRIVRAIDIHSRKLMDEYGLTGPQLAALRALLAGKARSARELTDVLRVSAPTVAGILERLERAGLIERSRNDSDRRQLDLTVTSKGKAAAEAAPSLLQDRFCRRLQGLHDWERTLLLSSLQRMAAMMDAEELEAAPHLVTGADRL